MKNTLIFVCLGFFLLSACQKNEITTDAKFDAFKESFIEDLWKIDPTWASSMGNHKYDNRLTVPNDVFRAELKSYVTAKLKGLEDFKKGALSESNQTDHALLENKMKGLIWSLTELKEYEWNPAAYNVGQGFADIIHGTHDSPENRLKNVSARLQFVPAYYETAKKQIKNPTIEHTDLAISQNRGALDVFGKDFDAIIQKSRLSENEKKELIRRVKTAKSAITDYVTWLEHDLKPKLTLATARSFRLGKDLYFKKFDFEIAASSSAEEIYKKALQHKSKLTSEMIKITKQLWPKYFKDEPYPAKDLKAVRALIDKVSLNHVKPDEFQSAIEKQIPELENFVRKNDLLYLDPEKPLIVRVEPAYMQGVAGASITAPGPYDAKANTYYNVGPLTNYSAAEAESYLREYNHYVLQILNIHEAIPGHYAQLVYSNKSPSLVKAIFGNDAMVEGWAVYAERMMLEEGYGGHEPEMWLMYNKWNLRVTTNTILDYSVHVLGIDEKEGMKLLVDEAFQQEQEARNKWRRATLTQVQLTSYFTGFSEIYGLREELKTKLGPNFKIKSFHEEFLSYGSAPVKYIRELMI